MLQALQLSQSGVQDKSEPTEQERKPAPTPCLRFPLPRGHTALIALLGHLQPEDTHRRALGQAFSSLLGFLLSLSDNQLSFLLPLPPLSVLPPPQLRLKNPSHQVVSQANPLSPFGFKVRAMQRPPLGVKMVIEAVCIMKEVKPKKVLGEKLGTKVDDYWEPGRGLLQDPGKFLDSLFKYDKVSGNRVEL